MSYKTYLLSIIIFCFGALYLTSAKAQQRESSKYEIEVSYTDGRIPELIYKLKPVGDFFSDKAILYVNQQEYHKLQSSGIKFKITEDLSMVGEELWSNREAYHSYEEIIELADSLVTNFPDICCLINYGNSIQGRSLSALKISDNALQDENEAEIIFDGGIHGNEIGAAENVIRFARDLCLGYNNDAEITELINKREIFLYLMVNPDGRHNVTRENANGVDINRDWGYMWDGWGGSSSAYSQPESKALRSCMYNNQFVIHTTYHSGTEYISCPWSYRSDQCPDYQDILHLASIYSDVSGYPNLEYGQGNTGMYAINGSSKDSNYGIMGSVSWSMEISNDKQPPASQIMYYYNNNKPSMLAMIEYAGYGIQGIVTDANSGEAVSAIIFVDNKFQVYTDPVVGDYHKYLLPGNYDIKVMANGYETAHVEGIEINDESVTEVNVSLNPLEEASYYAYKIASCQIPGNNEADEGNTMAVFGAPDMLNYSIGKNGWIVIDMQQPIIDGPGTDLIVYEGDSNFENFILYVSESMDGPWILAGEGSSTTEFDFAGLGISEAQYIKILDDGDGSANVDNAGFDLDAVEAPPHISGVYISIMDFSINDAAGNQNGRLDPGETAELCIELINNGDITSENTEANLHYNPSFVTIENPSASYGSLSQGESSVACFTLFCNEITPLAYVFHITINIESNNGTYSQAFDLDIPVGLLMEDWESGNFSSFDWLHGGSSPWTISDVNPFEGTYSAKSGAINDQQQSELSVIMEISSPGPISFFRKVSSESGYDFLEFYIDDNLMERWSGETSWDEVSYQSGIGTHTFKWVYSKDYSYSSGDDCGWIDLISFPPSNLQANGSMSGFVYDAATSAPLEGVSVAGMCTTDENGAYSLELPAGNYNICATHSAYETACENIVIEEGGTVDMNYMMYPATAIDEKHLDELSYTIAPNPFKKTTSFIIHSSEASSANLRIYNIQGALVYEEEINNSNTSHEFSWDGSDMNGKILNNTVYIYSIWLNDKIINGKIVKL